MKLTINRREVRKGLIFKHTDYILDVNIEFTEAEKQTIKKHKWNDNILLDQDLYGVTVNHKVQRFYKPISFTFQAIEALLKFERDLVEGAKDMKDSLEGVKSISTEGPMEVEL